MLPPERFLDLPTCLRRINLPRARNVRQFVFTRHLADTIPISDVQRTHKKWKQFSSDQGWPMLRVTTSRLTHSTMARSRAMRGNLSHDWETPTHPPWISELFRDWTSLPGNLNRKWAARYGANILTEWLSFFLLVLPLLYSYLLKRQDIKCLQQFWPLSDGELNPQQYSLSGESNEV